MAHDVFISYAIEDKASADAVCSKLEGRGVRCWMAPRDIMPGVPWPSAIVEAIDHCRVMVLVYSHHSNSSEMVMREVQLAADHESIIVPLRMEDVPLADFMQFFISSRHWLDAMTPPLEHHLEKLCDTVVALLQLPQPARAEVVEGQRHVPIVVEPLTGAEPLQVSPTITSPPSGGGGGRPTTANAGGFDKRTTTMMFGGLAAMLALAIGVLALILISRSSGGDDGVAVTPQPATATGTTAPKISANVSVPVPLTAGTEGVVPQQAIGACDPKQPIDWTFAWTPASDFPESNIEIFGPDGNVYWTDHTSSDSYSLSRTCLDFIDPGQLDGWSWRVQGRREQGSTGDWSDLQKFSVGSRADCGAAECQVSVVDQQLASPGCTLRVRTDPNVQAGIIVCFPPGTLLVLINESKYNDSYIWWKILIPGKDTSGWVAETNGDTQLISTAEPATS